MPGACLSSPIIAALPARTAGNWCRISLSMPAGEDWWAQLQLTDEARSQIVRECFLGECRRRSGRQWRSTIVHVPQAATEVVLHVIGRDSSGAVLRMAKLSRMAAALLLVWRGRRLMAFAMSGDRRGRIGRLRAVLGQAPARAGEAPPYAVWLDIYEAALPPVPPSSAVPFRVAVAGPDGPLLDATLGSLAAQTPHAADCVLIRCKADWAALAGQWIVLLQAGEVLAPSALAWFAHTAAINPGAAFVTADCDRLRGNGERADPVFKPGADPVLLTSFLPLQGACAVRLPEAGIELPVEANAARRMLALLRPDNVVHVPRILTHISDMALPPPPVFAVTARAVDFTPSVTMLVPTALRSAHVHDCLRRIVTQTDYPHFAVDLVITDAKATRPELQRAVTDLPKLRICKIALPDFNYAAANNHAAAQASGELLLLLNDDVAPVSAGWLSAMVAHMQDSRVGIVGARLLYGNAMVQHEGVVMGLAHMCEHEGRLRAGNTAGRHGMGLFDRQVSAVTAACLLIRADLYRDLGGMDESFAVALNDVDLCLRAREAGWRVVYCAHAEMWHYESLSLGRHYAGGRAALESLEVRRLRGRWADVIAADPFYSCLASLEPGREWQPGFPPRVAGLTAGAANPAATRS
jgi:GT2 family glycosyltransferase